MKTSFKNSFVHCIDKLDIMKKLILLLMLSATLMSCSEPNPYLDKIKEKVKQDAMGIEMNYNSISFKWTDTLTVGKQIAKITAKYDDGIKTILNNNYYSEDILTKKSLMKLRGFEDRVRNTPKGYKSFEAFAFANRNASSFISDLCNQYEETDRILSDWDNLEKGNLSLIRVATWYYQREDKFNGNSRGDWSLVTDILNSLGELQSEKNSLSEKDSNEVVEYKAYNVYTINNPLLNGAEVEIKKHFIFDNELNIIRTED